MLLIYFALINIISFLLFAIDKIKAKKNQWRIPESTLILVSFLGGGTGSLIGMVVFKHKLSKKKFTLGIPLIIILNKFLEIFLFIL
ncbi:MAG: DUF1294 domain-containing protein [Tissierellia bacterium]|nr:DUF1294 domain-containing protein [Tissierellia bacterium]